MAVITTGTLPWQERVMEAVQRLRLQGVLDLLPKHEKDRVLKMRQSLPVAAFEDCVPSEKFQQLMTMYRFVSDRS